MKIILVVCLIGVALAAPQRPTSLVQPLEELPPPPKPYQFGLQVSDDETTNYQSRQESQDEHGVVRGEYSWVAPDGIRYITAYTADAENGFQVNTREEQTNIVVIIPEPKPEFQTQNLVKRL